MELARVVAQFLGSARWNGSSECDDGLGDIRLERPVALAVVAALDVGDRLAGRDGHDLDQVRDPGLVSAHGGSRGPSR